MMLCSFVHVIIEASFVDLLSRERETTMMMTMVTLMMLTMMMLTMMMTLNEDETGCLVEEVAALFTSTVMSWRKQAG